MSAALTLTRSALVHLKAGLGSSKVGLLIYNAINGLEGPGYIREATVEIATADVLDLFDTPITLVAAPGAGLYNEFVSATLWLDYNSIAYDGVAAGEDLIISYTNGAGRLCASQETTGFIDQANDEQRLVMAQPIAVNGTVQDFIPVANAALVISLLTAEIATGNSPLKVKTLYRVRDMTW